MGRKIPNSGKAKRTTLLSKRANKVVEYTPFPDEEIVKTAQSPLVSLELPHSSNRSGKVSNINDEQVSKREGKMRLESRFLRLPLELIQHYQNISATQELIRPIPAQLSYCLSQDVAPAELANLTCPKRPKWNFDMTKKEVERNEEVYFEKWLAQTDSALSTYSSTLRGTPSPSFYERNLQVWRQLWRVTEASEILLVLIDVRFPLIHYPPSLEDYVRTLKPRKKVILVLTKTDLVPRYLAEAWRDWFEQRENSEGGGGAAVVIMEAYVEIERTSSTQGTQARYAPAAPAPSRNSLISALKAAHLDLLTPPKIVSDYPERLAKWKDRVRRHVDWDNIEAEPEVMEPQENIATALPAPIIKEKPLPGSKKDLRRAKVKAKNLYVPRQAKPIPGQVIIEVEETPKVIEKKTPLVAEEEFPFLTVGLIGQPNVGKSSLLNALLRRKAVRASRTAGKTKTLQTIFWNSTLRLSDSPGLVVPSFSGIERQILSSVLPIQNVEVVAHFITQRMPLEIILNLKRPEDEEVYSESWTTDDILNSYAEELGMKTAKAGRNDIYRAGAFLLRQIHSSTIPYAFRPPVENLPKNEFGLWLKGFDRRQGKTSKEILREMEDEGSGEDDGTSEEGENDEESEEESEGDGIGGVNSAIQSAFSLLQVEGGEDDSESEDSEN